MASQMGTDDAQLLNDNNLLAQAAAQGVNLDDLRRLVEDSLLSGDRSSSLLNTIQGHPVASQAPGQLTGQPAASLFNSNNNHNFGSNSNNTNNALSQFSASQLLMAGIDPSTISTLATANSGGGGGNAASQFSNMGSTMADLVGANHHLQSPTHNNFGNHHHHLNGNLGNASSSGNHDQAAAAAMAASQAVRRNSGFGGGGGGGVNMEKDVLEDLYKILHASEQNSNNNQNNNMSASNQLHHQLSHQTQLADAALGQAANELLGVQQQQQQHQQQQQQFQQQQYAPNSSAGMDAQNFQQLLNNLDHREAAALFLAQQQQQQQQQQSSQQHNSFSDELSRATASLSNAGNFDVGSPANILSLANNGFQQDFNSNAINRNAGGNSWPSAFTNSALAGMNGMLSLSNTSNTGNSLMGSASERLDIAANVAAVLDRSEKSNKSTKSSAAAAAKKALAPVRALSAYNFFFRAERERIISGKDNDDEDGEPADYSDAKKRQLLEGHWFRDRSVRRPHRRTHGKIAFTTLSKVISTRWREMPEENKRFYRTVAAEDLERYQRELNSRKNSDDVTHPSPQKTPDLSSVLPLIHIPPPLADSLAPRPQEPMLSHGKAPTEADDDVGVDVNDEGSLGGERSEDGVAV